MTHKIGWWTMVVLAIAISVYGFVLYGYMDVREAPFVQQKQAMQLSDSWYVWLVIHAMSSSMALLVGWMQFLKRWRVQRMGVHRAIGYVYVLAIATGGVSALIISPSATGGFAAAFGFGALALCWMASTGIGLYAIVAAGDRVGHGDWMLRSYALTLAAVTLRLYLGVATAAFGEESFDSYYRVIAWLCWVPNLFAAEWFIRRRRRSVGKNKRSRAAARI